jgi:hypothetical protein
MSLRFALSEGLSTPHRGGSAPDRQGGPRRDNACVSPQPGTGLQDTSVSGYARRRATRLLVHRTPRSAVGQKHALPQCNSNGRFTSRSRHRGLAVCRLVCAAKGLSPAPPKDHNRKYAANRPGMGAPAPGSRTREFSPVGSIRGPSLEKLAQSQTRRGRGNARDVEACEIGALRE